MNYIWVKIEVMAGSPLHNAFDEAIKVCRSIGITTKVEFNGRFITVSPSTTMNDVYNQFAQLEQKNSQ